jgi:amino acid permease
MLQKIWYTNSHRGCCVKMRNHFDISLLIFLADNNINRMILKAKMFSREIKCFLNISNWLRMLREFISVATNTFEGDYFIFLLPYNAELRFRMKILYLFLMPLCCVFFYTQMSVLGEFFKDLFTWIVTELMSYDSLCVSHSALKII